MAKYSIKLSPPPEGEDKEGDIVSVYCDCEQEHEAKVLGEVGQLLEWWCPIKNELKRDVNA